MPRTITSKTNEAPRPYPAAHHLLAYLEEGKVRVYAPRRQSLWVMQQLPAEEEQKVETLLHELHRTQRRTVVTEIRLRGDDGMECVRVLCVKT